MYSLLRERRWQGTLGIRAVGVGRREVDFAPRLVGIVTYDENIELLAPLAMPAHAQYVRTQVSEQYEIPDFITVDSQIPTELLEEQTEDVPVKIEYKSAPTRFGQVQSDQPIRASGLPPLSSTTIQPGDFVAGEDRAGIRPGPGTLSTIASRKGSSDPLILSAAHVLGNNDYKVLFGSVTARYVGEVIDTNSDLDVAIAEVHVPWMVDCRVKDIGMVPAAPIMGWSDMPVQMVGCRSGHQKGWMNIPVNIPASSVELGVVHHHLVTIDSQPGDSGALLLSGHGVTSAVDPDFADPRYLNSTTCAMMGILVAGPSSTPSPTVRPQSYFTPITHVLNDFGLDPDPWTRAI
jgi:hypothetical protein